MIRGLQLDSLKSIIIQGKSILILLYFRIDNDFKSENMIDLK